MPKGYIWKGIKIEFLLPGYVYMIGIQGYYISKCMEIFYFRLCMIWESIPSISMTEGNQYLNELESSYLIFKEYQFG